MRILIVIALSIAGLFLGLLLAQVSESNSAGVWERLPAPPFEIIELIPTGYSPMFVMTADGITYRYEEWQNQGWIAETLPQLPIDSTEIEIQKPCDMSAPEFSRAFNPPQDIKDCFQEEVTYADGFLRYTFILDEDGYIWESSISHNIYDSLFGMICFGSLGLLLGASVGLLATILPRTRKTKSKNIPTIA